MEIEIEVLRGVTMPWEPWRPHRGHQIAIKMRDNFSRSTARLGEERVCLDF